MASVMVLLVVLVTLCLVRPGNCHQGLAEQEQQHNWVPWALVSEVWAAEAVEAEEGEGQQALE